MGKIKTSTILILVFIGCVQIVLMAWVYISPSWQYGLRQQKMHRSATELKNKSTEEIILKIDANRDWKKPRIWNSDSKYIVFEEAIKALGDRSDEKALAKLKEIVLTYPEGQKWTVISSIEKNKNKAMVPVLCEALKRHTLQYTDELIVKALISIDDASAMECFIQEKDKILARTSRGDMDKAIERWSKLGTNGK